MDFLKSTVPDRRCADLPWQRDMEELSRQQAEPDHSTGRPPQALPMALERRC